MRLLLLLSLSVLFLAPEARAQVCPSPLATGDWSAVDTYALEASERQERSLTSLADYLKRAGRSDGARIRAVYRWTTDRIAYDVPALTGRRPSQSADTTLANRKGVCEGYARLMVALLTNMGIEAKFVGGWGLPPSGSASIAPDGLHAWVAAKSESGWILMDPTWGAGGVSGSRFIRRFNPRWFATPPDQFVQTHIPETEAFQLLATPLSLTDAVARVSPEASCLREPGGTTRRNSTSSRVTLADDGPPWQVNQSVRFRLLSEIPEAGYASGSTTTIALEIPDAYAVAIFDGMVLNQELRASGDIWSNSVRVGSQPVRVAVRTARGDRWRIIASVHVE